MTHICISDLTIVGSDNGLSPGRRQAIIRTNAGILLIRPLGTNFSEILIEILIFSLKKMHLKVSSAKRRPSCLSLNVLRYLDLAVIWAWKLQSHHSGSYDTHNRHHTAGPEGQYIKCLSWIQNLLSTFYFSSMLCCMQYHVILINGMLRPIWAMHCCYHCVLWLPVWNDVWGLMAELMHPGKY